MIFVLSVYKFHPGLRLFVDTQTRNVVMFFYTEFSPHKCTGIEKKYFKLTLKTSREKRKDYNS